MRRVDLPAATTLLVAALMLFFPGPGTGQQKDDQPHPKTLQELQHAMKDVLDKEHVPGAGVALVANGEVLWCGGFGEADIAAKRATGCDTEFRVGSISKTFVALALLKLQEEGKINLYARLQDSAPEGPFQNRWEVTHPVRVVNLLEHTAGFDDLEPSEVYNAHDRYDFPLLEVFKRFREPQKARWPPGTRMSYSNPGNAIAGYLIEKTTGKPFDQYIRETFLRPMGMERAGYPFTEANRALLATAYEGNPPRASGYPFIYLRPAGDLKASPGELAKLVQFLLRRGKPGDAHLVNPQKPVITLPAKALEMFAGYCAPRAPRSQLFAFVDDLTGGTRIRAINGKLTRSGLFGRPEPLLYVGKTMFRGEKEPEGTTVFFATETGDLAVVSSGLDGLSYSDRSSLALPFFRITVLALLLLFIFPSSPSPPLCPS